jgi:arylsulfatase A
LRRGGKTKWDWKSVVRLTEEWQPLIKPFISSTDQTICLTDFFATCADILDQPLPETSCEDSYSFLPALNGDPIISARQDVIHHSISGHIAYRMGKWKLCLAKGSGGWTSPKEVEVEKGATIAQLYDLENDPGETNNLYKTHPEIAERLLQ